jgi:hypothetical protein
MSYHNREFIFFNEKNQKLDFVFQKKNILIVFRYLNMFFMGQKPKYFGLYDIMFQKYNMVFGSVFYKHHCLIIIARASLAVIG